MREPPLHTHTHTHTHAASRFLLLLCLSYSFSSISVCPQLCLCFKERSRRSLCFPTESGRERERERETIGKQLLTHVTVQRCEGKSPKTCLSSTPKRFQPYMSPHLSSFSFFPLLFSSSRCILLSVISNRLKVTAATLHSRLSLSLSHTHTHRQCVRLPLG